MSISQDTFKKVLGSFCTGVTIVTFKNNETAHGLTVSAFSSLSLDPPLVLVCIKKDGVSHKMMLETDSFAVNILSDKQMDLAWRFADSKLNSEERFAGAELATDASQPVFAENLSHLICKITDRFEGGDHSIFVGEVQEAGINEGEKPLVYFSGGFPKIQ